MATRAMLLRRAALFSPSSSHLLHARCLSTTGRTAQKDSWLNKLLVRKIEPTKESHSRMLSDKEVIYELQTHNLKPGTGEEYLKNYANYVKAVSDKPMHLELQGSWTVSVGDQDQCVHLWKYAGGYTAIDAANKIFTTDPDLTSLIKDRNQFLRQRSNQFLLPFSFWPPVSPRDGGNIYEIRSYFLKPGTMIEWGNNWARAIHFRQANNEAFGGFFSQVGRLYNVHHIWCYSSLEGRKEARENAWRHPGWDEVVAYTVPLIQEMHARILVPNTFSPAQ
ncbi:protein NipSnap-like isoform X2 [Penaeus japonicus]|uniref:protein NipSnap-like isoform X2 n=1 Tax=Penaeus japonicus TaxID=27405 RepID=UPI001C70DCD9|nr:protein NipSnap-like isoform X2 [Penaeus japonicus]